MDSVSKIEADALELRNRIFGYLESVGREYGHFEMSNEGASFEWFDSESAEMAQVNRVVWSTDTESTTVFLGPTQANPRGRSIPVSEMDLDGLLILMQRVAGMVRQREANLQELIGGSFPTTMRDVMQETNQVMEEVETRVRGMLFAVTESEGGLYNFPNGKAVAVRFGDDGEFGRIDAFCIQEGRLLMREISSDTSRFVPAEKIGYDALVPLLRKIPSEKAERVVVNETEKDLLDRLRTRQREVDQLRSVLGISNGNQIIWQADTPEGLVVVEADGFGSAMMMEVEGNFPVDYQTLFSKRIGSETRAVELANEWHDSNLTLEALFEQKEREGVTIS